MNNANAKGHQKNYQNNHQKNNYSSNANNNKDRKVTNNPDRKIENKKKSKPAIIINKDVIRETREIEQERLEQEQVEKLAVEKETITENEVKQNISDAEFEVKTEPKEPEISESNIQKEINATSIETPLISEAVPEVSTEQSVKVVEKKETDTKADETISGDTDEIKEAKETVHLVTTIPVQNEEKKEKRPSTITLKDKSEGFKKIIDVAIAYAKLEDDRKKLIGQINSKNEEIKALREEKKDLQASLDSAKQLYKKQQEDIDGLKKVIDHRNDVIDIVKADKEESAQEYKMALAKALSTYVQDFKELKELEMSDDVGYALTETLEGVFKVLGKNGITI